MSSADSRPNILIITTDQHNPTCMGYEGHPVVRTPNIDALARSGTIFSRAYVTNPVCSPTRASLFTGLYPSGHRLRMNGIALSPSVPTFTQALLDSGYTTYCVGKIHLQTSGGPKGAPTSEIDPDRFIECSALWHAGRRRKLPSPYYGLEQTDYANDLWISWKNTLACHLNVDPYEMVLTGSGAIGFSLNPEKNYKQYHEGSDIDVGVVSLYHFEVAWHYMRQGRSSWLSLPPRTRRALTSHQKHHVFLGAIATDLILPLLPFGTQW